MIDIIIDEGNRSGEQILMAVIPSWRQWNSIEWFTDCCILMHATDTIAAPGFQ